MSPCGTQSTMKRGDKPPTLGVIQKKGTPGPRWSEQMFQKNADYREYIRYGTITAKNKALELHKELNPRQSSGEGEKDNFFVNASKPKATSGRAIRIGTDCSGMEAPIQAMRNLKVKHDHVFSCDNDEYVRATIEANFPCKDLYENVMSRDNDQVADVDVYVAGFPCQPFSTAGKQLGFDDMKGGGRGCIFFRILKYIQNRRPHIFILENVKGLVNLDGGKYLKIILDSLHDIGKTDVNEQGGTSGRSLYEVHHQVLNTKDHGVPQNRERWYCVGIRKGSLKETKSRFRFPEPFKCKPIQLFLDRLPETGVENETGSAAKNIAKAELMINDSGADPHSKHFIVDCDASSTRVHWMEGISPCLTRARSKGHWSKEGLPKRT